MGLAAEGPTGKNFIAEGGEGLKAAERVEDPYKGPTWLGPTTKAFFTADFKYYDPPGYLISSILYLPLFKGKRGSPGLSRRSTQAERSEAPPVHPEPTATEESPPMRKEEERPEPMVITSNRNKT